MLVALIDGFLGNVTVKPPSGGWKVGKGFRVNFVKDLSDFRTLYAQSDVFDIVQSN